MPEVIFTNGMKRWSLKPGRFQYMSLFKRRRCELFATHRPEQICGAGLGLEIHRTKQVTRSPGWALPGTVPDFRTPDPHPEPPLKRDIVGVVHFTHSHLVVTAALILTFSPGEKGQRLQSSFHAVACRGNPVKGASGFMGSMRDIFREILTLTLALPSDGQGDAIG
jgi:hypothetical protein